MLSLVAAHSVCKQAGAESRQEAARDIANICRQIQSIQLAVQSPLQHKLESHLSPKLMDVRALNRQIMQHTLATCLRPPHDFPTKCCELVTEYTYIHPEDEMAWAFREAAALYEEYAYNPVTCRQKIIDRTCVQRIKNILCAVEQANKTIIAPGKIREHICGLFSTISLREADKSILQLVASICHHQSSHNKRIAREFFEDLGEIQKNSHQRELFCKSIQYGMFLAEGIATLTALNHPAETPVVHGRIAHLLQKIQAMAAAQADAVSVMICDEAETYHLAPIFVRYKNQTLDIVITDSIRNTIQVCSKTGAIRHELLREIDAFFAKNHLSANLYFFDVQRLYNTDTCGVFVAQDIEHFYMLQKRETTLFDIAKKKAKSALVFASSLTIYPFDYLPLPMMKCTQSSKVLDSYLKTHPEAQAESTSFTHFESLPENLARHQVMVSYESRKTNIMITKGVNNQATMLFMGYLKQLFFHCFPDVQKAEQAAYLIA